MSLGRGQTLESVRKKIENELQGRINQYNMADYTNESIEKFCHRLADDAELTESLHSSQCSGRSEERDVSHLMGSCSSNAGNWMTQPGPLQKQQPPVSRLAARWPKDTDAVPEQESSVVTSVSSPEGSCQQ
ncbi:uncharacterized protein LOC124154746 [Ischnura elegans]|uniref:uncharacterized protein LOC124154746 n=1 Tax=Ischnura elegans TaxID=197161 RepID=UPI001ED8A873|nr:uncharacterized protein LOC124154746 [Ischnura elegans]